MIHSFWDVVQRYKAVFFDAFGVLKNYHGIIPGVPDVLVRMKAAGIDIYVITNDASKSPELMAGTYTHPVHGGLISADRIISSGILAAEYLRDRVRTGIVAFLGTPESVVYVERAGLIGVPVSQVADESQIKALVLLDDEGFDWFADLNAAVNLLRRRNIPLIVANPDIAYPVSLTEVSLATGSLALLIERAVSRDALRFGKPDPQIFAHAFSQAQKRSPDLRKQDVLMVGDTLFTDIQGAGKFGIDTALVLSGNTQKESVDMQIQSSGIVPDYVLNSIVV